MNHMKNLAFSLDVEAEDKVVLIMIPDPEICCMNCLGKFLMSFANGLIKEEKTETGELH